MTNMEKLSVTINNVDARNTIIQLSNLINIKFNPSRPDNVDIFIPNELEQIFQFFFSVVDELYRTNKG